MSSLHQDRLLVEGPETATAAGSPLAPARGPSRRPTGEKVSKRVPTQRQGKAERSGSTTTDADRSLTTQRPKRSTTSLAAAAASGAAGTIAARAKSAKTATARAASATAATARAATVKAATAKAATAKEATTKVVARSAARNASAAKPTLAKATPAPKATPAKATPAAKPTTAPKAPAAAKPTVAKPATAKATPVAKPTGAKATSVRKPAAKNAVTKQTPAAKLTAATPSVQVPALEPACVARARGAHRATPYKRTPVEQPVPAPAVVVEPAETVTAMAGGPRAPFLRRRPPTIRRRPALYLAAALVGALGVSALSTTGPSAQATETVSHSISVAQELGIHAAPTEAVIDSAGTEHLGELAASRNARDAEQTAAAAVQANADQAAVEAAVEAARPQAVLPVAGALITSGFGPRWGTLHAGIDFAAPMDTPEMAVMDGIVLKAGPASGFGLAVYIQHANGDVTVYGHMDKILVQEGQVVKAGDTIALLGNRGQATGPHLHLEVHVGGINGAKVDPLPWLRERGLPV